MDHLDYIRIRGLTSAESEVFQGLGGASLSVESGGSGGGESGSGTAIEWGDIPETALEMVTQYTQDLNDWIAEAVRYDPETRSRALIPELLDNLPAIPAIAGTLVASGAALPALPAIATVMLSQAIMNQVGVGVSNYVASLDENSPANILKKALLHDNEEKSILATALLNEEEASILEERLTGIQEGVEDLTFIDAEVKYADNTSLHVKGKVLNH